MFVAAFMANLSKLYCLDWRQVERYLFHQDYFQSPKLGGRRVLWKWQTQGQGSPSWIESCWSEGDRQRSPLSHQENRQPLQVSQGHLGSFERSIPSPVSILIVGLRVGWRPLRLCSIYAVHMITLIVAIGINEIVLRELVKYSWLNVITWQLVFWTPSRHACFSRSVSEATRPESCSPFKASKSSVFCPRSLWWLHGLSHRPSNTTFTSSILFDNNPCDHSYSLSSPASINMGSSFQLKFYFLSSFFAIRERNEQEEQKKSWCLKSRNSNLLCQNVFLKRWKHQTFVETKSTCKNTTPISVFSWCVYV